MSNSKLYSTTQILNDVYSSDTNSLRLVETGTLTFITGVTAVTVDTSTTSLFMPGNTGWIDMRPYESALWVCEHTALAGTLSNASVGFQTSDDGINSLDLANAPYGYAAQTGGAMTVSATHYISFGGPIRTISSDRASTLLTTVRSGKIPNYIRPGIIKSAGTATSLTVKWSLYGKRF
jgi:hypothetical protein